jgi:zinc-ribbon domain
MTGLMQRIRRRRAERPTAAEPKVGLPAGVETRDPDAPGHSSPSLRERARLRRRLREVRRIRELGLRDLGGLVFDQHRFERPNEDLVRGKVEALLAADRELRAIEKALDDRRPFTELREPGIAACPRCGALHGSDARFCSSCGAAVGAGASPTGVSAPRVRAS